MLQTDASGQFSQSEKLSNKSSQRYYVKCPKLYFCSESIIDFVGIYFLKISIFIFFLEILAFDFYKNLQTENIISYLPGGRANALPKKIKNSICNILVFTSELKKTASCQTCFLRMQNDYMIMNNDSGQLVKVEVTIARTDTQGFLIIHMGLSITSKCDKDQTNSRGKSVFQTKT